MRKYVLVACAIIVTSVSMAQTVLWLEDFQNGCSSNCQAITYTGPNGTWTETSTGVNGTDANVWYISGKECGNNAGVCGSDCGFSDASLHIGTNASVFGDQGATYLNNGAGFFFPETDKRIESPLINMSANSNLTLTFNYLENGDGTNDNATLWYFDGSTWTMLQDLSKTATTCAPAGIWTSFSLALPASADFNPGIKIAFRWQNNDDAVGTNPSFAVDDIRITTPSGPPPTAGITASALTVCAGQSLIFNDNSTGTNINSYIWSFGAGNPGTANTAGPHTVTFNTVGTFNVWHQVTDDNGTSSIQIQITVTPCSSPTAAFSISNNTICPGICATFNNNSTTTGPTTYLWNFPGGSPSSSSSSNPGSVCYTTPGTYSVSLTVTNSFGSSTYNQSLTVKAAPTITAFGNTILEMGESTVIGATASEGTINWSWSPNNQGAIFNCNSADCSSATVAPVITTYFEATTTSAEGCSASAFVNVIVAFQAFVDVPTMFSPNDDKNNDILFVKGVGITEMKFRVFNRYGQLVFETIDPSEGWDGTVNGIKENAATYVYTLTYKLIDNSTGEKTGKVTLVR